MRTDPSAPTEANISLPPPARLNAMSYTCGHTPEDKEGARTHGGESHGADTHIPLCHGQSAGFSRVLTPGSLGLTLDPSPGPR